MYRRSHLTNVCLYILLRMYRYIIHLELHPVGKGGGGGGGGGGTYEGLEANRCPLKISKFSEENSGKRLLYKWVYLLLLAIVNIAYTLIFFCLNP